MDALICMGEGEYFLHVSIDLVCSSPSRGASEAATFFQPVKCPGLAAPYTCWRVKNCTPGAGFWLWKVSESTNSS